MARIWSSGVELQSATSAVEFDTVTGASIDTTLKRSGAASIKLNPSASTQRVVHRVTGSGTTEVYGRAYVYITTAPSAQEDLCGFADNVQGGGVGIRINTDRTLELWDLGNAVQLGSDSSALNTGQWYRIEFWIEAAGTTWQMEGKIDGTTFAVDNSQAAPGSGGSFDFYLGTAPAAFTNTGSGTYEINFDDIAVNDTSGSAQTSWPGAGSIVHMQPDAEGDNTSVLAGTYADIDEVTPDDATTMVTMTTGSALIDVNCESSSNAGIGSSDTVTLVQVGIRESALSAASEGWNLRIKSASGGTTTDGTTTTHNDTTWRTNGDALPRIYTLTSYTDPTTGVAWTPTGTNSLDNMQIGINGSDPVPTIQVSTLWALVEYVPAAGGGGGDTDWPKFQKRGFWSWEF